ncbi:hypothetical protein FRC04_006934 [Tulasnella sp. 424]|nr:hypothetical protein FRC04_006934 [Tulasnella sp. 424]
MGQDVWSRYSGGSGAPAEFEWVDPLQDPPAGSSSVSVTKPPLSHVPIQARETEIFVLLFLSKGRDLVVTYSSSTGARACNWKYDPNRTDFVRRTRRQYTWCGKLVEGRVQFSPGLPL